jgi:hypothetical protein
MLPGNYTRCYYTTARVIHNDSEPESDWLWINSSLSHEFNTAESAQTLANLSNDNGREYGLDVNEYPYFVVKVTRTSHVEKVPTVVEDWPDDQS